jgi:hypothetical protein
VTRDASRYLLVVLVLPCMIWSASALAYDRYPTNCAAEADRVARDNSSVAAGAVRGAARGAVFGAVVGGDREDARRGAAAGATVSAVRNGARQSDIRREVYDDCMRRNRY